MHTPQPAAGEALMRLLAPVVQKVRRRAARQRNQIGHPAADCRTVKDFQHTCEIAAFYAFRDLGGDPEAPEAFDWERHWWLLQCRAHRHLRRETQGRHTAYGDARTRVSSRELSPAPLLWTAWEEPDQARVLEARDLREAQLNLIEEDLEKILTPEQYWIVSEVHYQNRRLRDVAKEWATTTPGYEGADGWRRAEKTLSSWYFRGIRRARQALLPRFQALAEDV